MPQKEGFLEGYFPFENKKGEVALLMSFCYKQYDPEENGSSHHAGRLFIGQGQSADGRL